MSGPSEQDLKECFEAFDKDSSGFIDEKEIKDVCKALGIEAKADEVEELMKATDTNNDGKISYEEFKKAVLGE